MIGSFGFVSAAPFTEIDAGLRLTTNKSVRLTCNCQPDFTLCRKNIQKFYHALVSDFTKPGYDLVIRFKPTTSKNQGEITYEENC